jgi:hypothetical protein
LTGIFANQNIDFVQSEGLFSVNFRKGFRSALACTEDRALLGSNSSAVQDSIKSMKKAAIGCLFSYVHAYGELCGKSQGYGDWSPSGYIKLQF